MNRPYHLVETMSADTTLCGQSAHTRYCVLQSSANDDGSDTRFSNVHYGRLCAKCVKARRKVHA